MALDQKRYEHKHETLLRDIRPLSSRMASGLANSSYSSAIFMIATVSVYINAWALTFADLILFFMFIYFLWLNTRDRSLAFKLPRGSRYLDGNAGRKGQKGKADGILYMGNVDRTNEEVWFTNSDARTHILYLGTTGAGKTEGLKSLVTNALSWGSGFVYVDGKADTDLWSSLSSLVRRFGRDDDLLVLNYMTGNSDVQAPSNSMNPFSSGSSSYLVNMLVSLMPESGGDNAMWKERAVSLVGALMPVLTWKRTHQDMPMSVRTIRENLTLSSIIRLARDETVPREVRTGLTSYLDTLPGFVGAAYDDNGQVKPPGPDTPQVNTETASQQHGYLAMQFTRSLQSLGDDYGYIFDTQAADVDMVDVVLNRRILVVLVPALEKSGDEIANLGKIVSASIKGMMGSTLGATVEGDSASVIENKPTHSGTPFMTVFDEVGYYVAEGMAVMAAQARSLGFCLVFSGQDLPALKKRVREEANSITANCNIKIFGKLEDPTETKDFFEKTVGSALVTEVSGYQMGDASEFRSYNDSRQAGVQLRPRASYDGLRGFKEGQAVITYGDTVCDCSMFYSNPGFAKAMRVTRFLALPPPDENIIKYANAITKLRDLMVNKTWTAARADVAIETSTEIAALKDGFKKSKRPKVNPIDAGIAALIQLHALENALPEPTAQAFSAESDDDSDSGKGGGGSSSDGGAAMPREKIPPIVTTPTVSIPSAPPLQQQSAANPLARFASGGDASQESPLVAKRPVDVTAASPQPVASPLPAAPQPVVATPAQSQQPASTETAAKPAIFGGAKPAAPVAPVTPPPGAAEPPAPVIPPASPIQQPAAKPAIFGGTKPAATETPAGSAPVVPPVSSAQAQPPAADAPAKPAIFGGAKPAAQAAPVTPPPGAAEPSAPVTPPASPIQQPAAKPAIFGGTKPAAETPAAPPPPVVAPEQPSAEQPPAQPAGFKPAIFGGAKPAQPEQTPPAQTSDEEALRKAAEEAKKNLFGGNGNGDHQDGQ